MNKITDINFRRQKNGKLQSQRGDFRLVLLRRGIADVTAGVRGATAAVRALGGSCWTS